MVSNLNPNDIYTVRLGNGLYYRERPNEEGTWVTHAERASLYSRQKATAIVKKMLDEGIPVGIQKMKITQK